MWRIEKGPTTISTFSPGPALLRADPILQVFLTENFDFLCCRTYKSTTSTTLFLKRKEPEFNIMHFNFFLFSVTSLLQLHSVRRRVPGTQPHWSVARIQKRENGAPKHYDFTVSFCTASCY